MTPRQKQEKQRRQVRKLAKFMLMAVLNAIRIFAGILLGTAGAVCCMYKGSDMIGIIEMIAGFLIVIMVIGDIEDPEKRGKKRREETTYESEAEGLCGHGRRSGKVGKRIA